MQRYKKYGVGKYIGGSLYLHKNYINVLPEEIQNIINTAEVPFEWTIVKINEYTNSISLIECKNWDTENEPEIGRTYLIKEFGEPKVIEAPKDPWIYHHKWLFVKDDYTGFDVEKNKRRTQQIEELTNIDKNKIGKKSYWSSVSNKLNESISFNNWKDADVNKEYEVEYKKHVKNEMGDIYPELDNFKKAYETADVIEITPEMDLKIRNRSRTESYDELLSLIKMYRSYPEFRNEETLKAIYKGFKNNLPMEYPIVLKKDGIMRVMSGNTRMDVAFQLGINPKVKLIDFNKLNENVQKIVQKHTKNCTDIYKEAIDYKLWNYKEIEQEIASGDTSINQIPATVTYLSENNIVQNGDLIADIGGGRYDKTIEWAKSIGAELYVYDPFNRSKEYNEMAVNKIADGKCDIAMANNVLNVIKEKENRLHVIKQVYDCLKNGKTGYFLIYQGNPNDKGEGKITKSINGKAVNWQNNQPASFYIPEIIEVFGNAEKVKGYTNLIKADKKGEALKEDYVTSYKNRWSDEGESVDIIVNPNNDEWEYVAYDARGFIDKDGNLYLEAYKEPRTYSDTVHDDLLKALYYDKKIPYLTENYLDFFHRYFKGEELKYGITVQRIGKYKSIRIGESVEETGEYDVNNINILFNMCSKKNPDISFFEPKKSLVEYQFMTGRNYWQQNNVGFPEKQFKINLNPTIQELKELPIGVRGIISPMGDLYVCEDNRIIHADLIISLGKLSSIDIPHEEDWDYPEGIQEGWICVQRWGNTNKFYIGESSYEWKKNRESIELVFELAKEKNPELNFNLQRITEVKEFKESLTESLSSEVYHWTNINALNEIIKTNQFKLSTSLGNKNEEDITVQGKPYYMSFSSIKYGGYARSAIADGVRMTSAILVMNGDKLNNRYTSKPVSYYSDLYVTTQDRERVLEYDENEERLFNDKPYIDNALSYIKEIHIYIGIEKELTSWNYEQMAKISVVDSNEELKEKGIKVYFYDNINAYKLLNKNKALSELPEEFKDLKPNTPNTGKRYSLTVFSDIIFPLLVYVDLFDTQLAENIKQYVLSYYKEILENKKENISPEEQYKIHKKEAIDMYSKYATSDLYFMLQADLQNYKKDDEAKPLIYLLTQIMKEFKTYKLKDFVSLLQSINILKNRLPQIEQFNNIKELKSFVENELKKKDITISNNLKEDIYALLDSELN